MVLRRVAHQSGLIGSLGAVARSASLGAVSDVPVAMVGVSAVRGRLQLAVLVGVLALAVGCSGDSNVAEQANGDMESRAPVASPSAGEDEAVDAYLAMWDDAATASWTSDAEHPALDDHAADDALALLKYVMQDHAEAGQVARGAPQHDVRVVDSSAGRRYVRDCMDSSGWLMYDRDGELVDDVPGSHRWVEATVEHRGARWLVADLVLHERATC